MSFNIFKEANSGLHEPNSICNEWPKVARVFGAESLASCAKWLAWVSPREEIHLSVKLPPWECFKIRPDRCCVQESRFHFRDQVRAGKTFDLAKSDCPQIWDCSFKSEINAAVSGTKADMSCLGSIHMGYSVCLKQSMMTAAAIKMQMKAIINPSDKFLPSEVCVYHPTRLQCPVGCFDSCWRNGWLPFSPSASSRPP